MKTMLTSLLAASAMIFSAHAADFTTKLTDVHLCCGSCVAGAKKAVATVPGVSADVSQDDETITLTGPDTATVQKAVNALTTVGYFGKCSDAGIKVDSSTGAKNQKVKTLDVSSVHLCCGTCVKDVNQALLAVPGVKATTAAKNAKTFEVTGDFNDADVFAALQKIGLTGKEGK